MRKIYSFSELGKEIKTNELVLLLVLKSDSEQSESASKNFEDIVEKIRNW